ncbi:MAG: choice-of-anchor V domain-containing protein [Saprospiraceae bacterium]
MKNHYPSKALSITALITIVVLFLANSSNPPNRRTGAPGDNGTCIGCHGDLNPQGFTGFVDILNFPSNIESGITYNLTARVTNSNGIAVRGGFQAVVLNESAGNTNAGDITIPVGTNPSTVTSAGREYVEHNPAKFFPASTEISWDFDWIAPMNATPGDVIKIYTAAVIGNGSGSLNDLVVSASFSGTMAEGADPLMVQITDSDPVNCFEGINGSATAMANDGTSPYEFEWSNGEVTASATMLPAGNQTVTVTDAMGATATASITIGQPDAPISATAMTTPESAVGAMNGSIDLNTMGGTPGYTFLWSNAATTESINNLTAGEYCVTITDTNNCSIVSCFQVEQIACDLSLTGSVNPNICENDCNGSIDIIIAGGDGNYTFAWSNNETTEDLEQLCNGTYFVTITDGANCQIEGSFVLSGAELMVNEAVMTNPTCVGACDGSIILSTTGVGPFDYDWSVDLLDGMSTVSGLCTDGYDVTVTDGNGCTELLCFEINDPDPLGIGVSTTASCASECTGTLTYQATGGTAPYTINLTEEDLCPGTYNATLTDANGCSLLFSVTIDELPGPTFTILDSGDDMNGQSDGFFDISISDGIPPFTFDWVLNGGSVSNLMDPDNLAAGDYTLIVTDDNNCQFTFTDDLTIGSTTSTSQQYAHDDISIYPNPAIDVVYILLGTKAPTVISVFDFSGKMVLEQSDMESNVAKHTLDVSELAAGVYAFRVKLGERVFVERIVVEK